MLVALSIREGLQLITKKGVSRLAMTHIIKRVKDRAVTLLQILIVVIIISILAIIALPNFLKVQERALVREAIINLKLIATAEKIYRMKNAFYYPDTGSELNFTNINNYLKLFLSEKNWDYDISGASANTFTVTADRKTGTYSSCIYTVDQGTADPYQSSALNTCP